MGGRGRDAVHIGKGALQAGAVYECPGRASKARSPLGVLDVQGRAADDHPIAEALLFHGDPLGQEMPPLA